MLFDSGENLEHVRIQTVNLILPAPLRKHEATVEKASKIVRNPALLKSEFLSYLTDMVGFSSEQLHNRKPRLVGKSAEELSIQSELQTQTPLSTNKYDSTNIC